MASSDKTLSYFVTVTLDYFGYKTEMLSEDRADTVLTYTLSGKV